MPGLATDAAESGDSEDILAVRATSLQRRFPMRSIKSGLNRRTWAVIALAMVFAIAGAGLVLSYLPSTGNVTAEELSASAENKKQDLLDGLAEGRILYWKTDEIQKGRLGPGPSDLPDRLITESWLTQGEGGRLGEVVGISKDDAGNTVIHGHYADGQSTTKYVDANERIVQAVPSDATVEDWLDGIWARAQSGFDKEGESESREIVDGKETVIFEWQRDRDEERPERGRVKKKVQMVIADPLLAREVTYQVDGSGTETLVLDFSVTEYRLLPAGSTMPAAP